MKLGQLAPPQKLYGQPASFHEKNTFLYDICNLANSQLGSQTAHHTMCMAVSFTITNNLHHIKH